MKLILIIILLSFSTLISANDLENSEVEVINLHESKSLDQMVLDNLNNKNDINEVDENNVSWLLGLLIMKIPEAKQIIPNAKIFCGPNLSINMPRPNVTTPQIIA